MNTYPYYISAFMDAGVLRKIFNDKKFKTYNEAVNAMKNKYERLSKIWGGKNSFYTSQIAILEYTQEYKGRIVTLFTDGNEVEISIPKVIE